MHNCQIFYHSQGTIDNPYTLNISDMPYWGATVNSEATNFYKITGITPGIRYSLSAPTDTKYHPQLTFFDSDSTFQNAICLSPIDEDFFANVSYYPQCNFITGFDTIYVSVSIPSEGTSFRLQLYESSIQYTESYHPFYVNSSSFPLNGEVSTGDDMYYSVYNVQHDISYHISVTGLSDDIDLYVTGPITCANIRYLTTSESVNCTLPAPEEFSTPGSEINTLLIHIEGKFTMADTTYSLDVRPEPVNEGSVITPLDTGLTSLVDYSGQVAPSGGASYYMISGLLPGTTYTVTAKDMTSDVSLFLYADDATFQNISCSGNLVGTEPESCQWTATGNVAYLQISAFDQQGAYFNLTLQ